MRHRASFQGLTDWCQSHAKLTLDDYYTPILRYTILHTHFVVI